MQQKLLPEEWALRTEEFRRIRSDAMGSIERAISRPLSDWDVNAKTDCEISNTSQNRIELQQRTGHIITLHTLHQFPAYDGLLSGWPHPYWAIDNALTHVRESFSHIDAQPVLLEPTLQAFHLEQRGETVLQMPAFCSVALFESAAPITNGDWSCALFIWFEDTMGLNLSEKTLRQLADVSWMDCAVDCYF